MGCSRHLCGRSVDRLWIVYRTVMEVQGVFCGLQKTSTWQLPLTHATYHRAVKTYDCNSLYWAVTSCNRNRVPKEGWDTPPNRVDRLWTINKPITGQLQPEQKAHGLLQ